MNLTQNDICKASKQIGLTDNQTTDLLQALEEFSKSKSNILTTLIYFGALIVLSAMTWFYTAQLNHSQTLLVGVIYAFTFFGTGFYFWHVKKMRLPGGLLSSLGIVMVPLIVYSLQNLLNFWPNQTPDNYRDFFYWIQSKWVPMEFATLLIASLVLYFIRFPFITILIYSVIWFICMDLTYFFTQGKGDFFTAYSIVSMAVGFLLTGLGFLLSRKNKVDFSFWSYLFGMFLFWGGLTALNLPTELEYLTYFLINLGLLFSSNFFHRKIFLTFGALGIISYIAHLASLFSDSRIFSYLLGAIGFATIMLAIFLLRRKRKLTTN